MTRECSKTSGTTKALAATAAQLFAAADRVPFAGAALPRLALRRLTCQFGRHVEARGRLSERTLGRLHTRRPQGYNQLMRVPARGRRLLAIPLLMIATALAL